MNNKILEGKTAIITGSTRGIGKATARLFAREGANVVIVGRNEEECKRMVSDIEAEGGSAIYSCTDITDLASMNCMFDKAIEAYGRIDIMVCNAGRGAATSMVLDELYSEEDVDNVINLNLKANLHCVRRAAKEMIRTGTKGHIVCIASTAGMMGEWMGCVYAATKAGIIQFARSWAFELGKHGINVNCVAPGTIRNQDDKDLNDEVINSMSAVTPLGDIATPEDVANAVLFLASDSANMISGQTLPVDGGYSAVRYKGADIKNTL